MSLLVQVRHHFDRHRPASIRLALHWRAVALPHGPHPIYCPLIEHLWCNRHRLCQRLALEPQNVAAILLLLLYEGAMCGSKRSFRLSKTRAHRFEQPQNARQSSQTHNLPSYGSSMTVTTQW